MGWSDDYLEHHGILGQKWGVRRFETAGGKLTPAGKNRYNSVDGKYQKLKKVASALADPSGNVKGGPVKDNIERGNKLRLKYGKKTTFENNQEYIKPVKDVSKKANSSDTKSTEKKDLTDKQKKMIIAGAAVAGTALAAYGGYKLYQLNKQAKEGLSGEYNNMAKKSFFDANEYAAKAQKFHMEGNFGKERYGADNLGVQAAKIGEEYFNNQSKLTKDLGKQLQAKANSKDFSVKEKVDYLKTKNDASRPQKQLEKAQQQYNAQASANKLASDASSLARSVTMTGPIKTSSKPAQNNTVKVNRTPVSYTPVNRTSVNKTPIKGSKTFIDASKANDDLVQELLKKNTLRF